MRTLLIRNGMVVTENTEEVCDVLCVDGKITQVGKDISLVNKVEINFSEVIDASGKIVIPGGIDVHTHLNLDTGTAVSCDDFYSGTVAAAYGGTTTIIDHPAFGPPLCDLDYQINKYNGLAGGRAVIDYGFHGVIQHVDNKVLSMMEDMAKEGITSFKLYLTYGYKISDDDVFKVFRRAKGLGLLIAVHAENDPLINMLRDEFIAAGKTKGIFHPQSRPSECEAEAVNRMILFAQMAKDAPLYIVHLSSALGLDFITAAKKKGQKNLFAETCPQYLLLDESCYSLPEDEWLKYIICPPLRTKADNNALWQGLITGIDTIATDHCSFMFKTQKLIGRNDFTKCPSGAPGIEERIPLMYSEGVAKSRISLRRFTDLCSANPARLFGLYPKKGVIAPGSDADIVIINPEKQVVINKGMLHGNADYTLFDGFETIGLPEITISRGEVIVRNGEFLGKAGRGEFLKRELFSPLA